MIAAFEDTNHVRIELSLMRGSTNGSPDLSVSGKAWELEADRRVAKPLVFVNATCLRERVKTLEGLVTFLLYQLDFQLGAYEWQKTGADRPSDPAR
jgi:hypothetical protein